MRRWRLPVSTTARILCRRSSMPRATFSSMSVWKTIRVNAESRPRSPTTSQQRCNRSRVGPRATIWPAAERRRPRPAPTNSATPVPIGTPGWWASRRRCPRRSGWAPSRVTSHWSTVGVVRFTARVCPPTFGRPPWTAPSVAPTSSPSPPLLRSAVTPVCPPRRPRRRRRPETRHLFKVPSARRRTTAFRRRRCRRRHRRPRVSRFFRD